MTVCSHRARAGRAAGCCVSEQCARTALRTGRAAPCTARHAPPAMAKLAASSERASCAERASSRTRRSRSTCTKSRVPRGTTTAASLRPPCSDGTKVPRDHARAFALLDKRCSRGSFAACQALGSILLMLAPESEHARAITVLKKACDGFEAEDRRRLLLGGQRLPRGLAREASRRSRVRVVLKSGQSSSTGRVHRTGSQLPRCSRHRGPLLRACYSASVATRMYSTSVL